MSQISSFVLDRCYFDTDDLSQLIGYCDASTRAACAVLYIRSINRHSQITIRFVCSKSRIPSIKGVDIHRIELIGAFLLAQIMKEVSVELNIGEVYCFSDSQVALS